MSSLAQKLRRVGRTKEAWFWEPNRDLFNPGGLEPEGVLAGALSGLGLHQVRKRVLPHLKRPFVEEMSADLPEELEYKGSLGDLDLEVELAKRRNPWDPHAPTRGGEYARARQPRGPREPMMALLKDFDRFEAEEAAHLADNIPGRQGHMHKATEGALAQAKEKIRGGKGFTYEELADALGFDAASRPVITHNPHMSNAFFLNKGNATLVDKVLTPKRMKLDEATWRHLRDRIDEKGLVHIGGYMLGRKGALSKADVVAHELGHATINQKGVLNALRRVSSSIPGKITGRLAGVAGLGTAAFGNTDSPYYEAASIGGAAVPVAQLLGEEATASIKANNAFKKLVSSGALTDAARKLARRRLLGAYGTYALGGLGALALPGSIIGGRKLYEASQE